MTAPTPVRSGPGGASFWIGVAIGVGLMGIGVRYAFVQSSLTHPFTLSKWLVGVLVVHDGIVLPTVGVTGWLLGRLLPRWAAGPVRGAAGLSVLLTVFAWPLVRRFGERPSVPSALPDDYARNLLIVLAVVWAGAAVVATVRWRSQRRLH